MMKRIRKAIVGGFAAGIAGVAGNIVITGAPTRDDVAKALGMFIVSFAVGAYAVWKVPNAPAIPGA